MNEVITFLENKGASIEDINKIMNIFLNIKCDDDSILNCLEYLYNLFSYAGLTDEQITMLLQNSRVIFDAYYKNFNDIKHYYKVNNCKVDNLYIIKLAYVLKETNYLDDVFRTKMHIYGANNYKRIFIRSYVYDRSKKIKAHNCKLITASEKISYGPQNSFGYVADKVLGPVVSNDIELEDKIDKLLKILTNNSDMTVERYITHMALKFYRDFHAYMNKKENNRGVK